MQGTGTYAYLPFDVPPGVARVEVEVRLVAARRQARGRPVRRPRHRVPVAGFRGIYGEERSAFFVAADVASQSFTPGPMDPGRWTVIVPVFLAEQPTTVTADRDPALRPGRAGRGSPVPQVGVVLDRPGWYRGDLHCHTPESSDAWHSRTALAPPDWADQARQQGLDYAALTDHNVISQNLALARDAGPDMLLMAGEEMTNWFDGHATVSGIAPGPVARLPADAGGPAAAGRRRPHPRLLPRRPRPGRLRLRRAPVLRAAGLAVQAGDGPPDSRPDGYEVWAGPFQADDEQSLTDWDAMLQRGWQIHANGGSDLHGTENNYGFRFGTPTTVVYAPRLAQPDVVGGAAGRSVVRDAAPRRRRVLPDRPRWPGRAPTSAGRCPAARGAGRGRGAGAGRGRDATGLLISDGRVVSTTPLTEDEQAVRARVPVPGYVRAEVRGKVRARARRASRSRSSWTWSA